MKEKSFKHGKVKNMKKYIVTVDGEKFEVVVQDADPNATYIPTSKAEAPKAEPVTPAVTSAPVTGNGLKVTAPLPGTILKVLAKQGQNIKKGDTLCVLEAMKMENEIVAPQDCTVASVAVNEGASVGSGDLLFVMV